MQEAQYKSHGLWTELEAARNTIAEIDKSGDIEAVRSIDEFRELLAITASFRDGEWALTTDAMLSQIQQSWGQINSYLTSYQSSPQPSYMSNAVAQGDSIRAQLSALPRPVAHGTAQANATRAFNLYREELDKSRERLVERLDQVLADAGDRETDLTAKIEELSGQVDVSKSSLAAVEDRIAQDEARLSAALTQNNETFIVGQTTRDKEFKSWLGEREKGFGTLAAPHIEAIAKADADARESLAVIIGLRTSTVDMSNLAAGDILADEYGKYAKSERRASYVSYIVGVVAVLGGIIIILFAFGSLQSDLDWQKVALKFGLTAAAGGIAVVAFRFGGQAIRRATSFKRQELELRALQTFLEGVDGKDLAKTAFLERAFGHAWDDSGRQSGEAEVNDLMMRVITSLVQNLPKSGG